MVHRSRTDKVMKIEELRIGNKVECYCAAMKVVEIGKETVTLVRADKVVTVHISRIKPIQLTTTKILNFGFKKSDYSDNVYSLKGFDILFGYGYNENEPHWHQGHDYEKGDGMSCIWKPIDYVHQLQNVVFELTGEELQ